MKSKEGCWNPSKEGFQIQAQKDFEIHAKKTFEIHALPKVHQPKVRKPKIHQPKVHQPKVHQGSPLIQAKKHMKSKQRRIWNPSKEGFEIQAKRDFDIRANKYPLEHVTNQDFKVQNFRIYE